MAGESAGRTTSIKGIAYLALTGLLLIVIQTTVMGRYRPWGHGPDLLLLLVIYMGLYATLPAGAALAVFLGFFMDSAGGGLLGFHPLVFLFILLAIQQAGQKIGPMALWQKTILVLISVLGSGVLSLATLYVFGHEISPVPESAESPITALVISSGLTTLIWPPFFWLMDRFRPSDLGRREQER